jgi:hypothetical protein
MHPNSPQPTSSHYRVASLLGESYKGMGGVELDVCLLACPCPPHPRSSLSGGIAGPGIPMSSSQRRARKAQVARQLALTLVVGHEGGGGERSRRTTMDDIERPAP